MFFNVFNFMAKGAREKKRFLFLFDEGPMLEMLDYTIRIGSTPTFLYFDLYICIYVYKLIINYFYYRKSL